MKEVSLQRREQVSAKCRYVNLSQAALEEQRRIRKDRLKRIRTQQLPITPWDTRDR